MIFGPGIWPDRWVSYSLRPHSLQVLGHGWPQQIDRFQIYTFFLNLAIVITFQLQPVLFLLVKQKNDKGSKIVHSFLQV